jgi:hypothetical protein
MLPKKGESAPYGYNTVHSTYLKHEADLNTGTGGTAIFLAYKQQLVRVYKLLTICVHTRTHIYVQNAVLVSVPDAALNSLRS